MVEDTKRRAIRRENQWLAVLVMKIEGCAWRCRNTIPPCICAIVPFSPSTIFAWNELLCEVQPHGSRFDGWPIGSCRKGNNDRGLQPLPEFTLSCKHRISVVHDLDGSEA